MSSKGDILPELESIAERRLWKEGNQAIIEVLVNSVGTTEHDNTWEKLYKSTNFTQTLWARLFDGEGSCYGAEVLKVESLKGLPKP